MIQFVCGGGPCHGILYDTVCLWWWTVSWYTLLTVVVDRVLYDTVCLWWVIQFVCVVDRVMVYSLLTVYDTVCLWWWTVSWYTLLTLYDTVCLWWWTVMVLTLYDTVCLWWWTVMVFVCSGGPCHGILY